SSTGTATFTVPLNGAWQAQVTNSYHSGPLSFTASYGGDPSNQGSTGSAQATVGLGLTTTSVSDTPAPSTFGQTATLTVTVAPVAPAIGTPTGSVSLTSDGNPIGTVNLSGGTATLPYSGLAAGTHTIGATYPGDGDFASSTGQTSQMVAPSNTSIAFTSSL